jgi:nucleoside phosphorylase
LQIIAVEMEGSGIADAAWVFRSGYLVIRGVSDYCDKNKDTVAHWRPYACIAAAAYARALLESIPAA